jgi:DNA-binding MarR family transcriptional regulator
LRRAARSLTALYDAALERDGLTLPQFSMLRAVQRLGEGQPIGRVARELRLDRTTLTRNLRPLVTKGWLVLHRGEDQRERTVSLSRAGERAVARALPAWERAQEAVEQRLGAARLRLLREALVELEALAR